MAVVQDILAFAEALHAFNKSGEQYIALTKGDVLLITKMEENGWWYAYQSKDHKAHGWAPSNYLKEMPYEEMQKLLAPLPSGMQDNLSNAAKRQSFAEHFKSVAVKHMYGTNDIIIRENEESRSLYLVGAGSARVVRTLEGGDMRVLASLGEDETLGELTFLKGGRTTATVIANSPSEVYAIDAVSFENSFANRSDVCEAFFLHIARKLAQRVKQTSAAKATDSAFSSIQRAPKVAGIGIFGVPLSFLMNKKKCFPDVLQESIAYLNNPSVWEVEGLFRRCGSEDSLVALRQSYDREESPDLSTADPLVVAQTLKLFFRSLPEPLLTFKLYNEFVKNAEKPEGLLPLLTSLPPHNKAVLGALLELLAKVASKQDINKMTPSNLGIVFGPTLMRDSQETPESMLVDVPKVNNCIKTLIEHAATFTPNLVVDLSSIGPQKEGAVLTVQADVDSLSNDAGVLSFTKGDIIEIVEDLGHGKLVGKLAGRQGSLQASMVRLCTRSTLTAVATEATQDYGAKFGLPSDSLLKAFRCTSEFGKGMVKRKGMFVVFKTHFCVFGSAFGVEAKLVIDINEVESISDKQSTHGSQKVEVKAGNKIVKVRSDDHAALMALCDQLHNQVKKGGATPVATAAIPPPTTEALQLDELLSNASAMHFPAESVVLAQGATKQCMYQVVTGDVRVEIGGKVLAYLGEGEIFGEISFLDGGGASATIVADSELDVLVLDGDNVRGKFQANPQLAGRFFHLLSLVLANRLLKMQSK